MQDDDDSTLTMENHLAAHPEDGVCPWCLRDEHLMNGCPRCLGDGRRGEDCPKCNGEGFTAPRRACMALRCRHGRRVEVA